MRFGDSDIRLSLERFRLIRDLIKERYGIRLTDDNRYVVENRLGERLAELRHDSFDEYYQYLRYHPQREQELEEAVDALTTNETYFFREDYQLRSFANDILPELRQRLQKRRRLMFWSAGCSSGEEAYTLAMLVLNSRLFSGWDVRIFGNDINRRVIKKARQGVYGPASFRTTDPLWIKRYFTETQDGMRINDDVRAMCHFGHLNLLDPNQIVFVSRADAIFCRNVLIYFDHDSKMKTISILYDHLNPGGYLLLGHTESLINVSTAFELVHLSEDLVYRRPEIGYGR